MIKIILKIPDKFFDNEINDKFQDFFNRVKVEINEGITSGDILLCGIYELETIVMLQRAFEHMEILDEGDTKI